jgi:hypothetical protein
MDSTLFFAAVILIFFFANTYYYVPYLHYMVHVVSTVFIITALGFQLFVLS